VLKALGGSLCRRLSRLQAALIATACGVDHQSHEERSGSSAKRTPLQLDGHHQVDARCDAVAVGRSRALGTNPERWRPERQGRGPAPVQASRPDDACAADQQASAAVQCRRRGPCRTGVQGLRR